MQVFHRTRIWLEQFLRLVDYDRIPEYRRLSWCERKYLDHAVVVMLISAPSFWRAVFWVGVMTVLMYVVSWHRDLVGAPRDLLRALPLIMSFPALAAARRRNMRTLLCNRDGDHGQRSRNAQQ